MNTGSYVCAKKEIVWCLLVSVGLTGVLAWLFYSTWWGMLLLPGVFVWYIRRYKNMQEKKQKEKFLCEFKDVMQALSSALLAGYSMENAWRDVERELKEQYKEASLLLPKIHRMNAGVRLNEPIEQALMELAAESDCEELESFAEIFSFAKRSGGDFAKIIHTTGKKLAGKMEVEQEIATVLAGKRLEGRVMNLMPLLILAYMKLTAGDFLDVLYGNFLGLCVMTAVLIGYVLAFKLSERILDIRI